MILNKQKGIQCVASIIHFCFHAVDPIYIWEHQNDLNHGLYHTIISKITSEEAFKTHAGHIYCEDEEMVERGN